MLIKDLVAYAISQINICRTMAFNLNVCPRVLFTSAQNNCKKELELAVSDYVEVYDGTENTSKSWSIPCTALYSCCNAMGSWDFMSLKTKTRVHWLMVTAQAVIDAMNTFDEEPVAIVVEPAVNVGNQEPNTTVMEQTSKDTAVSEPVRTEESPGVKPVPEISEQKQEMQLEVAEEEEEDPDLPKLVAQDPAEAESDDEAEDEEDEVPSPRRSTWIAGGIL
jgi:hypothetical protein